MSFLVFGPGTLPIRDQIFRHVVRQIVSWLWPAGHKLPGAQQLADELSVSINTVIAAYRELKYAKIIDSFSTRGYRVTDRSYALMWATGTLRRESVELIKMSRALGMDDADIVATFTKLVTGKRS